MEKGIGAAERGESIVDAIAQGRLLQLSAGQAARLAALGIGIGFQPAWIVASLFEVFGREFRSRTAGHAS